MRRMIAQEMDLWAGDISSSGPGVFTAVDAAGALTTLIDTNRVEPDDEFDSSYICINPGGSGNPALATIWRRIADTAGFINATGTFTLSTPVPSAPFAAVNMTYEIFKLFKPDQWMAGVNSALRQSFPRRHRLISWEVPEDAETNFYDWGHMVSGLSITNPTSAPTVAAVALGNSEWVAGTYKFAVSYYNSLGETIVTAVATQALLAGQAPQFAAITIPEQATGVNYYATPAPSGSQLARLAIGDAVLAGGTGPTPGTVGNDFVAQAIYFKAPPTRFGLVPPGFNTTAVDVAKLTGLMRRTNPGQFPERYVDLSPDRWRESGGTTIETYYLPIDQYSLHFIAIAPPCPMAAETDILSEPDEVVLAGAQWYLWELINKTSSAQNEAAWVVESKNAAARFKEALGKYGMTPPRRTMHRPFIAVPTFGMNGSW